MSDRICLYYAKINPLECCTNGNIISATNNFITKILDKYRNNIIFTLLERREDGNLLLYSPSLERHAIEI